MWDPIRKKLDRLRDLDRTCQVFGADSHEYQLRPTVSPTEIEDAEERLGTSLPEELKSFYLEMGNGVAGPHYGLFPLQEVTGYRPERPYPGVEALKETAAERYEGFTVPEDEDGYFELPYDVLRGLLFIIKEGSAHKTCLVSTGGDEGRVVRLSADGFVVEEDRGFREMYEDWLDEHIRILERVDELIDTDLSIHEIDSALQEELNVYSGKDLVMSRIGAEKPASLFGAGNTRIYDSSTQDPWYEEQLAAYREERRQSGRPETGESDLRETHDLEEGETPFNSSGEV